MKNNYYTNFQGYLKNGNRVAAFGRKKENKLEMFFLYCNSKDSFSKKIPKQLYEYYIENGLERLNFLFSEYHPILLLIPIKESDSDRYTFQKYIRDNFYKKRSKHCIYLEECLIKDDIEIIKKIKRTPKLLR